jgi:hypothetical protein
MCFQTNNIPCSQEKQCKVCFEKSFASQEKAKFWSDKNEIKPWQIKKGSSKKFWFKCEFGHEFETTLSHITSSRSWCPYPCCNVFSLKLCSEDCEICLNASFASHEKSKYWSDKNENKPRNYFRNCHKKFWFKCENEHEFETTPNHIMQGQWCPYPCCSISPKKLCSNECDICFNASFASHEKAKFWSKKNILNSRDVLKGTIKKFWFKCENGHEFETSLCNISRKESWCPECIRWKNQTNCLKIIQQITQKKFRQSKPKFLNGLELDGYNSELKLAIEYNGEQHYRYHPFFHRNEQSNFAKQQERDKLKFELCIQNGVYLIIVPYWTNNKDEFIQQKYQDFMLSQMID